jgi:transcriptional/translational regulatory protein YebC/TACO1
MIITVLEYAKKYNVSRRRVNEALQKGQKLQDVKSFRKSGGTWLIEIIEKL